MKNPFIQFDILESYSDEFSLRALPTGLHYWWVETERYKAAITVTGGQVIWYETSKHPHPVIWLSDFSHLDNSKSLRGGIPVCWPWFGRHRTDKSNPSHGLVRNIPWVIKDFKFENSEFTLRVTPTQTDEMRKHIPEGVVLTEVIKLTETLDVSLVTTNNSHAPYEFSAALHTYFYVGDIKETELHGLTQSHYISEQTNWQSTDSPKCYRFREHTDRIHIDQAEYAEIESPVHTYQLTQSGHNSLIVWNPWREVSTNTPGMGSEVWQEMLCVEPAAFKPYLNLKPGHSHTLKQHIDVVK